MNIYHTSSRLILSIVFGIVASVPVLAQSQDNQLIDAIQNDNIDITQSIKFQQFNSCNNMEDILSKFVKKLKPHYPPVMYMRGDVIEEDMVPVSAEPVAEKSLSNDMAVDNTIKSSSNDYSTTNNQKKGVDEPEIIKTNGKYIFYYNSQEQKVYIIDSPLDIQTSTINLDKANIHTEINLPKQFNNLNLFVTDDRLVILSTRYYNFNLRNTFVRRSDRTSIAIYDISNIDKLKLIKFSDIDGYYRDARLIDNKLYIISQLNINRWSLYENNDSDKSDTIKPQNILPKAIDVDTTDNNSVSITAPDCDQISYIMPSDETLEKTDLRPAFTVISVLNIEDTDKKTSTNVILADAGQIHITKDSLYIAQGLRFQNTVSCPLGRMCIMPRRDEGQYTLIHKLKLNGYDLDYKASNVVPGTLLTQYSMDEDTQGNFRLLTRASWRDGTNFYALDPDLKLKGQITGIEPGEQFKASRYIGDKLYLVTFRQTDPLFVIDIADIKNPEIIGKLKIPGFSTYLHPLGKIDNGIQYLVGLGFDADENGRQNGLKLDLYKVDYNNQDQLGMINIQQIASHTLGGPGSSSDAMYNPRLFVMDKNNVVTLPMILQKDKNNGEKCNVYIDNNGVETKTNCYPVIKKITYFAGLKSFKLDTDQGSISEIYSVDYLNLFSKLYKNDNYEDEYSNINYRQIRNTSMRVGFAGDALYMINNDFAHFSVPNNKDSKYIYFDKDLKNNNDCASLGEASSSGPVSPEYQWTKQCCEGLTSVVPSSAYNEDGEMAIGGGNICAKIGDGVCDSRYENKRNSKDCK